MTPTMLFNDYIETADLSHAQERELIDATQRGDDKAYETLLTQYAPLLKKQARAVPHHVDAEEVQATLLLGMVEAVTAFDSQKHESLAATLPHYLKRCLSDMGVTASSFTIPQRSLSRWLAITKKTDSIYSAIALAPQYGMSKATYMDILSALRATDSLDALLLGDTFVARSIKINTEDFTGETDQMLLDLVFELHDDENDLTDREAIVLRYAYGYMSYGNPQSDDSVGVTLGLSRPTVQRVRASALEKARRRLGLAVGA